MNSKVIFALSALFACACATQEFTLKFWDEFSGKLKVGAKMAITKTDDHFHAVVSDVELITKEGVTAENVLPSMSWVLADPIESVSFDFTFNPADGTFTVTSPDSASASAQRFATWIVQAIAQGKGIEHYYKKGEKPPTREADSFFGKCIVTNIKKVNEGDDLILTFDIDTANCSKRNPFVASPADSDSESMKYIFAHGTELKEMSFKVDFEKNGLAHHIGGKMVHAA